VATIISGELSRRQIRRESSRSWIKTIPTLPSTKRKKTLRFLLSFFSSLDDEENGGRLGAAATTRAIIPVFFLAITTFEVIAGVLSATS